MDPKEQIIFNLTRENELLKMENQYLREQLQRYCFYVLDKYQFKELLMVYL